MTRFVLLNPNTNRATTEAMCSLARAAAPGVLIEGRTAVIGVPMITTPAELDLAAEMVEASADSLAGAPPDALIIGAFGDPGLPSARARLTCPVVGIGEAAMREAAARGRTFAVVTVTPALSDSISAMAEHLGLAPQFRGVVLTEGSVGTVMASEATLHAALEAACRRALERGGVDALVIGGGPLGAAAQVLAPRLSVPVINPVAAATRRALALIAG